MWTGFINRLFCSRDIHRPARRDNTITPAPWSPPGCRFCSQAGIRRGWTSLTMAAKHQYLDAVKCLKNVSSRTGENQCFMTTFHRFIASSPIIETTLGFLATKIEDIGANLCSLLLGRFPGLASEIHLYIRTEPPQ